MYPIAPSPELGILAGLLDGYQVLAQVSPEGVILVKFSLEGDLLEVARTDFSSPTHREDEKRRLIGELKPVNVIRVKRFYLSGDHLGIRDYPKDVEEYLRDPSPLTGEYKRQLDIDARVVAEPK
jgi:hypothetical protein